MKNYFAVSIVFLPIRYSCEVKAATPNSINDGYKNVMRGLLGELIQYWGL